VSKGLLVMILAGIGFAYLVIGFVDEAESTTPGASNGASRKARAYQQYYKKDVNGDDTLYLAGLSLEKAKDVWAESTVRDSVLSYFPDFESMVQVAEGQLDESAFRRYLLKRLDNIEGKYIDGVIGLDQARQDCEAIR